MRNILVIIFFLVLLGEESFSQNIRVRSINGTSLQFVNVVIKSFPDSTKFSFFQISDSSGMVPVKLQKEGNYRLRASFIGYKSVDTLLNITDSIPSHFIIEMKEISKELNEVVVKGYRDVISQDGEKTIFNVELIANASTNGFEVLKKTPTIFVDNNGNVYLTSTTPATIYINGRELRMSQNDIATMLKNIPSKAIQKIEIIRVPSAKYDASNSGGAVNIILKKGVKLGLSGSIEASTNYGRYGDISLSSMLSNNDENKSTYISVSYNKVRNFEEGFTNRELFDSTIVRQSIYDKKASETFYLGYGYSTSIKSKVSFNYDGNLSYLTNTSSLFSNNTQSLSENIYLRSRDFTDNKNRIFSLNQSISSTYKIDTLGSELVGDISLSSSRKGMDILFNSDYQIPQIQNIVYDNKTENNQILLVGKLDYKKIWKNKSSLETGVKYSILNFKTDLVYNNSNDGAKAVLDLVNTKYSYNERVFAWYGMGTKYFGKLSLKGGTRIEGTRMNGNQLEPNDTTFMINRVDYFPYLHVSYPVLKVQGIEFKAFLVARRSITRPSYEYLNPTLQPISQFVYQTGNPSLKPQFTQTYEANITVANYPILAVGRHYTKDVFASVIYQDTKNPNITYKTYDNLGKNEETYLRLILGIPPSGKYFFFLGGQYSFFRYNGIYENTDLKFKKGSWLLFSYHQLNLDDETTLTLYGHLILNGQQQLIEFGTIGDLHFDINRYFLNKKIQVSLFANDILYKNPYSFELNQGGVRLNGFQKTDSRRFGISVKYNFGFGRKNTPIQNQSTSVGGGVFDVKMKP